MWLILALMTNKVHALPSGEKQPLSLNGLTHGAVVGLEYPVVIRDTRRSQVESLVKLVC